MKLSKLTLLVFLLLMFCGIVPVKAADGCYRDFDVPRGFICWIGDGIPGRAVRVNWVTYFPSVIK